MKIFLTLSILAATLVKGQVVGEQQDTNVLSRLPIGAILTKVSIPRFDEKKRRTSLLTAGIMEVISSDNLRGENLVIRLFNKEQKVSSTAIMAEANYLIEKEQLHATGELIMRSTEDKFLARSQGAILSMNIRQGLLLGPCETMFLQKEPPKKISMHQLETVLPLLTSIQLLAAAPPPEVTTDELVDFERRTAPIIAPAFEGPELLAQAINAEASINARLTTFLQVAGQTNLITQEPAKRAADTPFETLFKPNEQRIVISSSKGLYFDGETQELAYLGKINLKGRGMTFTCTKGMKAFFSQPQKKVSKEGAENESAAFGNFSGIGELQQFTALGDINLAGHDKKGQLIQVRGDRAVYDQKKQTVIIRGNGISFRIGNIAARTEDKDAYVVIRLLGGANLSLQSEGNWQGTLPDNKKK